MCNIIVKGLRYTFLDFLVNRIGVIGRKNVCLIMVAVSECYNKFKDLSYAK